MNNVLEQLQGVKVLPKKANPCFRAWVLVRSAAELHVWSLIFTSGCVFGIFCNPSGTVSTNITRMLTFTCMITWLLAIELV